MTSNASRRPYDLVLYGATGYQGKIIAQYLSANAPPSLKWAISGRNHLKLQDLLQFLHEEYPDRARPGVVVASLVRSDLEQMVAHTQLVLNTAGPFCRHGTVVVEACIEHSTAYVDCTGEHIWANEIATKFHEKAQARNAIIIPQCAVESSPPDVMCYMLADCISKGRHTPTGPITFSIQHSWPGFSGGMVASVFAGLEDYSLARMNAASAPLASCVPGAGLHRPYSTSLLPVRRDPDLGSLTFNPSAMADRAVVMRTWSLFQRHGGENEHYGERFSFSGYTRVNSLVQGWLSFLGTSVALLLVVVFPPFRWLLSWLAPARGIGPQVSGNEKHFVEWRAVAKADEENEGNWNRATGFMRIDIDVFSCSALLVSEAALSLVGQLAAARSESSVPSLAMRLRGGVLTPASLGWDYIERLKNAGLHTHVELLKNGEI